MAFTYAPAGEIYDLERRSPGSIVHLWNHPLADGRTAPFQACTISGEFYIKDLEGYFEFCGCPTQVKGGISRRAEKQEWQEQIRACPRIPGDIQRLVNLVRRRRRRDFATLYSLFCEIQNNMRAGKDQIIPDWAQ